MDFSSPPLGVSPGRASSLDPDGRHVPTTKSRPEIDVATEQTGSIRAGQGSGQDAAQQPAPVAKSAPAPAAATNSLEMVEAMARDLDESLRLVQKGSNLSSRF